MTLRPGDLVVLIGLPGAGKSTYAAKLQAQGALVVAYDGHRFDPARPRGAQPRELNYTRVYAALLAAIDRALPRQAVVVDALHLDPAERAYLIHRGTRRFAVVCRCPTARAARRRPHISRPAMLRMSQKLAPPTTGDPEGYTVWVLGQPGVPPWEGSGAELSRGWGQTHVAMDSQK